MLQAAQNSEQDDRAVADLVLHGSPLPPEIETIDLQFREASDGSPAIFLSFQVRRGVLLDDPAIVRLSRYMETVVDSLLRQGVSRFPFASLDEAA